MAFTSYNSRDINNFLIPAPQTSELLGPGVYQPESQFKELKKRTQSRKPPAFMDGIKPGFQTVAVGSNYHNMTYYPGPGKYNADSVLSAFSTEIVKDRGNDSQYFSINQSGKLTRRTQWFSADKTKKFATDDKSTSEFIHPSIGPDQYSPRNAAFDFGGTLQLKRFSEMTKEQLHYTLSTLNKTHNDIRLKTIFKNQ